MPNAKYFFTKLKNVYIKCITQVYYLLLALFLQRKTHTVVINYYYYYYYWGRLGARRFYRPDAILVTQWYGILGFNVPLDTV